MRSFDSAVGLTSKGHAHEWAAGCVGELRGWRVSQLRGGDAPCRQVRVSLLWGNGGQLHSPVLGLPMRTKLRRAYSTQRTLAIGLWVAHSHE